MITLCLCLFVAGRLAHRVINGLPVRPQRKGTSSMTSLKLRIMAVTAAMLFSTAKRASAMNTS
ncbi:protein of unknown function [Bradyrhizobium vignae]|uniref:Uncharacterized protein n=1 Tax=Bradyrhizobium vignae TaxID=1549949 RepID=A0A2U3PVY2_9BRAD|nr:protein of unknown function [Bradyrhizobium vignae]